MWPMLLDISKDECRGILRRLELEAYSSLLSAFRAQGALEQKKRDILDQIRTLLHINLDRHKAEIRRVTNDETLCTVAEQMCGGSTILDWSSAGRRAVPLITRGRLESAYTALADSIAMETFMRNKEITKLPDPKQIRKELVDHPNVAMQDHEQIRVQPRERGRKRHRTLSEEIVQPQQIPPPPPQPQPIPSTSKSTHLHSSRKLSQLHTNAKIKQLYNSQMKTKGRHHNHAVPSTSKHSSAGQTTKIKTNRQPGSGAPIPPSAVPSTSFVLPPPVVTSKVPTQKHTRKILESPIVNESAMLKPSAVASTVNAIEKENIHMDSEDSTKIHSESVKNVQQKLTQQIVAPVQQMPIPTSQNMQPHSIKISPVTTNTKVQYIVTAPRWSKTIKPTPVNTTSIVTTDEVKIKVPQQTSDKIVRPQNVTTQQIINNNMIRTTNIKQHHNGKNVKLVPIGATSKSRFIPGATSNKISMSNTTFAQLKPLAMQNIPPNKLQKLQFTTSDNNHYIPGKTNFILLQKPGKSKDSITITKDGKEISAKIIMPQTSVQQDVKRKDPSNVIVLGLSNAQASKHSVLSQILQVSGIIPAGSKSEIIIKNSEQVSEESFITEDTPVVVETGAETPVNNETSRSLSNRITLPNRPLLMNKPKLLKANVKPIQRNVVTNSVADVVPNTDWEAELDNASNKYTVHTNISNVENVTCNEASSEIKYIDYKIESNSNDNLSGLDKKIEEPHNPALEAETNNMKLENTIDNDAEMSNSELMRILNGSPDLIKQEGNDIFRKALQSADINLESVEYIEQDMTPSYDIVQTSRLQDTIVYAPQIENTDMDNMIEEVTDNNYYTESKDSIVMYNTTIEEMRDDSLCETAQLCGLDLNNLDTKTDIEYSVYENSHGTSQNYEMGSSEVEMSIISSMEVT